MNVTDPKHFVSRINFLSYNDIKLSNERLHENENANFVVMVRSFRYTSLDFFLRTTPLRKNIMDQTYDSLGFLHFKESELETHFLRVSGRILNTDEISSSDTFLNVLCWGITLHSTSGWGTSTPRPAWGPSQFYRSLLELKGLSYSKPDFRPYEILSSDNTHIIM